MKEPLNQQNWESRQQHIENIRKRQALVTKIKELRKALVILKMQTSRMEKKPLDNLYTEKRDELNRTTDKLSQLQADYGKLTQSEMSIFRTRLQKITEQIECSEVYDQDLEDHRFSLHQSIWTLQQEKEEALGDKDQAWSRYEVP